MGPLQIAQPLALLGLLALPALWWLLRATPPEPERAELPSLALLDQLDPREETPDRTPWWIIALRFAAALLVIIGFSRPIYMPNPDANALNGPTLIVIDDGWSSAERWREMTRAAMTEADAATQAGASVQLLFTAPQQLENDPAEAILADTARRRLQSATVSPWAPDRRAALIRLEESRLKPDHIVWITDGFDHGNASAFGESLAALAPTRIQPFTPRSAYALTAAVPANSGAAISVARASPGPAITTRILAETREGASLSSADAVFEAGALEATATFALPAAILNQVARFHILGAQSAGAVWLWDDAALTPTVAIADPPPSNQPLLEEYYYVRKALQPHASLIEGPLSDIIAKSPDAIILGDRSLDSGGDADALSAWIDAGGALVRFAGPQLASQSDAFTPTPLRPAARALGGALAWDQPQAIAAFPVNSPFADLAPPDDARVRRQVLAQPSPDLASQTWAKLEDGTPLVTARQQGRGAVILFHVTADPDWSDLPYTGAFVSMLRRAVASGDGGSHRRADITGHLAPLSTLNGAGQSGPPPDTAAPLSADAFNDARPGPHSPPGVYSGPQGSRALNTAISLPTQIMNWPANATVIEDTAYARRANLQGLFLTLALGLLCIDIIVALGVAGKLRFSRQRAHAVLMAFTMAGGLGLSLLGPAPAEAQTTRSSAPTPSQTSKQKDAALHLRFAYITTEDARLNDALRAGLEGLNWELYQRTSIEPAPPHGVTPGVDNLELYPLIYFAPARNAPALTSAQAQALNTYMRNGGGLIIDTRDAVPGQGFSDNLKTQLQGLNIPPLQPTPPDHVLNRSFYLTEGFPGRLPGGQLWIETTALHNAARRGDGVSSLFIGSSDWIGAWAIDADKRPIFPMDGDGQRRRELAYRFGVNLAMYVLTGNYKEDQVHLPALLERLDEENQAGSPDGQPRMRAVIPAPDTPRPRNGAPEDLLEFFEQRRRERNAQPGAEETAPQ